jgi:tetratricopeptide (TPR) repeat protein
LVRVGREHKISFQRVRDSFFGFKPLARLTSQDWVQLGSRQLARGNKKRAIARFERAIREDESNVRAYIGLAKAQYYFGNSQEAERACRQAFSINDAIKAGKLPNHRNLVPDKEPAAARIIQGKAYNDMLEYFGATASFREAQESR